MVIKAGEMSSKVYFILSGEIYIMSKDGRFDYGVLSEGSYFGDISVLLKQPSQFSYFFDPFQERPVMMLSIDASLFL